MTNHTAVAGQAPARINLLKVLGPVHVWALGVGIVLVGEFMGWNFSVAKGGAFGALIACWVIGLLYTCVAMIDSEVTSTVAAAGGQYTQAKHIIGPLMAFNVGLYLVMAYTMLEAADALVVGDLIKAVAAEFGHEDLDPKPFVLLTIAVLAWLNYRGVYMTLTVNFVITAAAFLSILILFIGVEPWNPGKILLHKELLTDLPYGWIGVVAALQFGMWYYLGIEGTCQAAEEVRSAGRSIPLGTMSGMLTLLIAAAITWYVAAGLMPWEYLGQAVTPLYDAARLVGSPALQVILFVGTLFSAIASANGCINDASRAWFSMGRDRYMPEWFGAVHPRYRTPYRAIIFLVPIAVSFAFTGLLDQVITFSILSGLLGYTFMAINIVKFRRQWPLGSINRGYVHPFHPIPAIVLAVLCVATYFATFLGYGASLLSIMAFYIVASIWFASHRYKYVRRGDQFTMSWPRPRGY
ncbi:APC family permease [Pelomicrobium methylotrophicum]|uniref:Amino acid permease n=1 Tax=Pelomicrobium methylotrophicum TaxID=2602750 RepID=A0A5C7EZD8_9PROT|nr:amino acid permease [Pelomicrobium methylotrophicum]TXF12686.1 amino acid permease [Pelomicrobium methylotrophicum]